MKKFSILVSRMNLLLFILWIILIALIPGFLATWLGVGGCFLRIPMLMYLLGLDIKEAYFVNQAVIAITTIPGVIEHYRKKHVFTRGALVAGLSAAVGVAIGAYVVAKYLPSDILKVVFGSACIIIGIIVARQTLMLKNKLKRRIVVTEVKHLECGYRLVLMMFLAGFATGICGFGGGIYYLPIYFMFDYPTHIAIGTSSAQMIITASVGASILAYYGFINIFIFICIGTLTLVASWAGAKLSARTMPWILRIAYSLLIIFAGGYVVYDSLKMLLYS